MSEKHLTNQPFSELDLDQSLLDGLTEAGFEYCTAIQAEALPAALAGRDVAGQAQTGTGKTAAFLLATFQYLSRHPADPKRTRTQPRAMVLAPTRELAIQIHRDAGELGKYSGHRLGLAYGGTGYEKQRELLARGVDILIGTPGRLIDYLKQGVFDLKGIQVVVLDEADRMFDLGFIRDIRYLLRRMPSPTKRLNLLFSATLSHRVSELAYEHMNAPQIVKIESDKVVVDEVQESIYYPANEEKISLLLGLLKQTGADRTLVFVNTKHMAEETFRWLKGNEYLAAVLSGDVPQRKREQLLQAFKDGQISILVATDLAARGLHIESVSHVFNYDLPQDGEDYVHRVGRTARAGAHGNAISFACEKYAFSLMDIEEYLGHSIPVQRITDDLLAIPKPATAPTPRERRPSRTQRSQKSEGSRRKPRGDAGRRAEKPQRRHHHKPVAKDTSEKSVEQGAPHQTGAGDRSKSEHGSHKPAVVPKRIKPETPVIG